MIGFIALPIAALAAYALGGLDWLRKKLLPPAAPTSGVAGAPVPKPDYGHCSTANYNFKLFINGVLFDGNLQSRGAFGFRNVDGYYTLLTNGMFSKLYLDSIPPKNNWEIRDIYRPDGLTEACDSPTTPAPSPPIGGDGIANSPAPNIEVDGLRVIQGSPIAKVPNFANAFLMALAAARNALDALAAVKALADALETLKDLLDNLKDSLDGEDEDANDKAKSVYRYDFGSISRDGFLRLYPDANTNKLRASYIDLHILSIPIGYGKYFGNLSPHFYRFRSLGYISFVSPTFGVMEVREIEFSRMSLEVPENAFGFFYHLGLDGSIIANASGFYVKVEKAAP